MACQSTAGQAIIFPPKISAWVLCVRVLCKRRRSFIRSFSRLSKDASYLRKGVKGCSKISRVLAKSRLILDEMCPLYGKFASYLRRALFFLVWMALVCICIMLTKFLFGGKGGGGEVESVAYRWTTQWLCGYLGCENTLWLPVSYLNINRKYQSKQSPRYSTTQDTERMQTDLAIFKKKKENNLLFNWIFFFNL